MVVSFSCTSRNGLLSTPAGSGCRIAGIGVDFGRFEGRYNTVAVNAAFYQNVRNGVRGSVVLQNDLSIPNVTMDHCAVNTERSVTARVNQGIMVVGRIKADFGFDASDRGLILRVFTNNLFDEFPVMYGFVFYRRFQSIYSTCGPAFVE